MRYRLRTLLILLTLLPPLVATLGMAFFNLRPEPPSVSGRLIWKGMPVDAGVVVFTSQANPKLQFTAKTDQAGAFQLPVDAKGRPIQTGTYDMSFVLPPNLPPPGGAMQVSISPGKTQVDFELR